MPVVRLRLAEIMESQGFTPAHLAECSRVPTGAVLRLVQDRPPVRVRLELLGRLAGVLGVSVGRLLADVPEALTCEVRISTTGTAAADERDRLTDLEAEWAHEFPETARRDPDARRKWPSLFDHAV